MFQSGGDLIRRALVAHARKRKSNMYRCPVNCGGTRCDWPLAGRSGHAAWPATPLQIPVVESKRALLGQGSTALARSQSPGAGFAGYQPASTRIKRRRLNPKAKAGSVRLRRPVRRILFVSTWEYLKDQVLLDKARFHSCIEFSNASCPEVSALMKIVEEARQNQGKALLAHLNRSINQLAHACSAARADMDRTAGPRAGASAARSHRRRGREQGSRTTVWKHMSLRMCSF